MIPRPMTAATSGTKTKTMAAAVTRRIKGRTAAIATAAAESIDVRVSVMNTVSAAKANGRTSTLQRAIRSNPITSKRAIERRGQAS